MKKRQTPRVKPKAAGTGPFHPDRDVAVADRHPAGGSGLVIA